jgi:hypothetical protein
MQAKNEKIRKLLSNANKNCFLINNNPKLKINPKLKRNQEQLIKQAPRNKALRLYPCDKK